MERKIHGMEEIRYQLVISQLVSDRDKWRNVVSLSSSYSFLL